MRVALLRSVNVGGRTVTGATLCEVLTRMGLQEVRTFIASGNLLFEEPEATPDADLEARIAGALASHLGWPVTVMVRDPPALTAAADHPLVSELAPERGETLQVGFWAAAPDPSAAAAVEKLAPAMDELRVAGREVYWLCRGSVARSKLTTARLERAGGLAVTLRNINTVRRLVTLTG